MYKSKITKLAINFLKILIFCPGMVCPLISVLAEKIQNITHFCSGIEKITLSNLFYRIPVLSESHCRYDLLPPDISQDIISGTS